MAFEYNIEEILKIAEQIEENGVKFYTDAADAASDSDAKQLLLNLADFEKEHKKAFASIRENLSEKEKQNLIFDPQDESAQYLKALADMRVFFKKQIDIKNIEEILKEALIAEKDSILFYQAMKPLISEQSGKEKIQIIIKEEMKHINILTEKLTALKN
ncbi:MAG: ferritin family protein [Deltaproteobacteria bacterium]|nr:ferritin family protein [Deltaproteobacteria bacterium]